MYSPHRRRPFHHLDDTGGGIDERFPLRGVIAESGAAIIGKTLWEKYGKLPAYSNFGPMVNPDASALVAYKN